MAEFDHSKVKDFFISRRGSYSRQTASIYVLCVKIGLAFWLRARSSKSVNSYTKK